MKHYFTSTLSVLAIFTLSIGVSSSAFAQDTSDQPAKAQVEVKKPSLTYYYIDQ